jgi:hypothetical protein
MILEDSIEHKFVKREFLTEIRLKKIKTNE